DIQTNSVFRNEKSLIGYVQNLNCVDVSNVPGVARVETLYARDFLKTTQANKKIAEGYVLKVDMLHQLQRGIPFDRLFE
ncbi:MAG: excisionase, partial [Sphaerochaeta sp.]|nr:excisionase [Sphaerochaeta sp.]